MSEFVVVFTTTPDQGMAEAIAQELVRRRLAACVQVGGPVASHYRWQGAMECTTEWTCSIKTRRELFDGVAAVIRELHAYDVPEIVACPILAGSESYLGWLSHETQSEI